MTAPLKWPEKAEDVRMESLSNVRRIREILRNIAKVTREIETTKSLMDAIELTYSTEIKLNSVGSKAEKEKRTMGY